MPASRLFPVLLAALAVWAEPPAFQPRPLPALIAEARRAAPPAQPPDLLVPDLVDLAALDPTLRLDIRYATRDNFLGAPVYAEGRAFLQRPVAAAVARVNRALRAKGYALRIHDAYRPWWVTKVFWEATEPAKRAYVANPAKGSVHNRGCAVDLSLVRAADGAEVEMPSAYDDFSPKSHPDYPGGSEAARRHRDLLRAAMAAEGFSVDKEEWWHYDHPLSARYPVLNLAFEAIGRPAPELDRAGQVLLVTTADWNANAGTLQRFERGAGGTLAKVGPPLAVWLGKKGMAWRSDEGAPPPPVDGPVKREGDGRSPAGILSFGDMWGYAEQAPAGVRLAYRRATDCDRCVDDADHADYNRILRLPSAQAPVTWRSAEQLLLDTEHYRHMVVIHYNDERPRRGAGSCIFLHVAVPPGLYTAGCTALTAGDLLDLLRWLDPARQPLLVQVPLPAFDLARAAWNLPEELRPN